MQPFCDWITLYQVHPTGCPVFKSGQVMAIDADGEIEWHTVKAVEHEGSFDTRVLISSDGERVRLSGNVSRFGRPDNLFGLSVDQAVERASALCVSNGLPAFSPSRRLQRVSSDRGHDTVGHEGARLTRVDLTVNYATGGPRELEYFLRYLSAQQPGRLRAATYGECTTVTWGFGSKYASAKVYGKLAEMRKHGGLIDWRVEEFLADKGIARAEVTLKSRFLTQRGLCWWQPGAVDWESLYMERLGTEVEATRATIDDVVDLPASVQGTYHMWRQGVPVQDVLSRATFFRHRKALRAFGVDIAHPCNVAAFPVKVRTVSVERVSAPEWYRAA